MNTPSTSTTEETPAEILSGFANIDNYAQEALKKLLLATKASNQLPAAGDDYDYYTSFESFRRVMNMESSRILQVIHKLFRFHGAKGNIGSTRATDVQDKMDILIDANDQLLERVGTLLDEAAGLKKKEDPILVTTAITSPPPTSSGSWNKKLGKDETSKKTYHMISAKNIARPQLKFADKIDNSPRAFVPKLKEKPNAIRPIPNSIVLAQSTDEVKQIEDKNAAVIVYPHPYQYELDHLTYPDFVYKDSVQKPQPLSDELLTYVDTLPALENTIKVLERQTEIAVDLEAHTYRTYQGFVCLMQISTRTHDYIIDTLALRQHMHLCNIVFTNPLILKVFHGASSDIVWLQRDFGVYVVCMFDTYHASRVLSYARLSLAFLVNRFCNVSPDKQYQLADWRIRPLPEELIKYAREDTHYLLYIYDKMKSELLAKSNSQQNLLQAVLNSSKEFCFRTYSKPLHDVDEIVESCTRGKAIHNNRQISALRELADWRDKISRTEDESNGFVLPKHMMLQIANVLPREPQGILACCNPVPPFVRQYLHEIHAIVQTAREQPLQVPVTPKQVFSIEKVKHSEDLMFLECPYDISYSLEAPVVEDDGTQLVKEKEVPSLPLFLPKKDKLSRGEQLAEAIRASIVNPFTMYQRQSKTASTGAPAPAHPSTAAAECDAELDTSLSPKAWKLLPNTKVQITLKEDKPKTPSVTPIEEKPQLSMRAQASADKKRKMTRDEDTKDDGDESTPEKQAKLPFEETEKSSEQPAESSSEQSAKRRKKKQKKKAAITAQAEGGENKDEKNEEQSPLGFEPHNYDNVNYSAFIDQSKKKKKFTDKEDMMFKGKAKSNRGSNFNRKSISFKSRGGQGKRLNR